jgi:hypothetical protein
MEDWIDPYRGRKVELITNIFDISFNFEWTELFVIELVIKFYYFDVSS